MRRRKRNEGGAAVLTALILAVSGIYLAFRTWTAVQTMWAPAPKAVVPLSGSTLTAVSQAEARDARLAEVGEPERDPFNRVRTARRNTPRTSRPAPVPEAKPVLRMILYDQIRPEVQFSLGPHLSGRLRPGQSFLGWTVMSISTRSCLISKDGQTLTLTPRR